MTAPTFSERITAVVLAEKIRGHLLDAASALAELATILDADLERSRAEAEK